MAAVAAHSAEFTPRQFGRLTIVFENTIARVEALLKGMMFDCL
jgi:hypothetical protein